MRESTKMQITASLIFIGLMISTYLAFNMGSMAYEAVYIYGEGDLSNFSDWKWLRLIYVCFAFVSHLALLALLKTKRFALLAVISSLLIFGVFLLFLSPLAGDFI